MSLMSFSDSDEEVFRDVDPLLERREDSTAASRPEGRTVEVQVQGRGSNGAPPGARREYHLTHMAAGTSNGVVIIVSLITLVSTSHMTSSVYMESSCSILWHCHNLMPDSCTAKVGANDKKEWRGGGD